MRDTVSTLCILLIIGGISVTGLILVPTQVAAQSSGELKLNNNTVTISPYEQKKIDILYNNPTSTATRGFEYTINFNPDVINVTDHSPSGFNNEINNNQGILEYASTKTVDSNTTSTVISTITIRAADGATVGDSSNISFSGVEVLTPAINTIPTESRTGNVEVKRKVPKNVRNAVAKQNSPDDSVGFDDLISAINAYHSENGELDGVKITDEDLTGLINQYNTA
jgi:hypothetical protein